NDPRKNNNDNQKVPDRKLQQNNAAINEIVLLWNVYHQQRNAEAIEVVVGVGPAGKVKPRSDETDYECRSHSDLARTWRSCALSGVHHGGDLGTSLVARGCGLQTTQRSAPASMRFHSEYIVCWDFLPVSGSVQSAVGYASFGAL